MCLIFLLDNCIVSVSYQRVAATNFDFKRIRIQCKLRIHYIVESEDILAALFFRNREFSIRKGCDSRFYNSGLVRIFRLQIVDEVLGDIGFQLKLNLLVSSYVNILLPLGFIIKVFYKLLKPG